MEVSYILPSDFSHKFEGLFSEIERRREEFGVTSFGASVTTLEEVFFKVGETYGSNEITDDTKYLSVDALGNSFAWSLNSFGSKFLIKRLIFWEWDKIFT